MAELDRKGTHQARFELTLLGEITTMHSGSLIDTILPRDLNESFTPGLYPSTPW